MSASEPAVIVTGSSRGIGPAVARFLGARGIPVAVNYACDDAAATRVVRDIESLAWIHRSGRGRLG